MSRSKKYFYLSSLMIILSFFFNTNNVFLSGLFNSFIKLILFCSVINSIVLILSIIFADRSIKSLKPDADWIRIASKAIHHIQKETNTQVIAGGLINTIDEVNEAVKNGAKYVTTSYDKLW